jgi:hypothetical protein
MNPRPEFSSWEFLLGRHRHQNRLVSRTVDGVDLSFNGNPICRKRRSPELQRFEPSRPSRWGSWSRLRRLSLRWLELRGTKPQVCVIPYLIQTECNNWEPKWSHVMELVTLVSTRSFWAKFWFSERTSFSMLTFLIVVDRISSRIAESKNCQTKDSIAGATKGLNSTTTLVHRIQGSCNCISVWMKIIWRQRFYMNFLISRFSWCGNSHVM